MNKAVKHIFLLISAILLFSCSGDVLYDNSTRVANPDWKIDSIAKFDVAVEDTCTLYKTEILVRNSGRYEYQNLWLFVTKTSPDSTIEKDTMECFLADDYGRWTGSGIGSLYTNMFVLEDSVRFDHIGVYSYEIEHGMRTDPLKGINDIGLKIEERE